MKPPDPSNAGENDELHRFFELSPDMLCIAGADGFFKRINAAWEKTLGHSKEELMAVPYLSFVHSEDKEATIAEAQKLSSGRDTIWFENRYRCRDGSYRWLLWKATAIQDSAAIYAAARDITAHKCATEDLRRATLDLERSNRELEQFASIASHDLQEPLRMITSYLDLLQRRFHEKLGPEAEKFIGVAADGANRMRGLIQDLLTFSRVGSQAHAMQTIELEKIVSDVLKSLAIAIAESGAQVICSSLPKVTGDATQLTQLFQNLIANAIKFRGVEAPQVRIAARADGDVWHLEVSDQGIGIDPKFFDQLFTVFRRLHTRSEYPGTGIGLAVCKKVVERHGGRIWIESAPGKGTTFHFTIPVAGESSKLRSTSSEPNTPAEKGSQVA